MICLVSLGVLINVSIIIDFNKMKYSVPYMEQAIEAPGKIMFRILNYKADTIELVFSFLVMSPVNIKME